MGPTWGSSGTDRTQVGPMLALWTLLSGFFFVTCCNMNMSLTSIWSLIAMIRLSHDSLHNGIKSALTCVLNYQGTPFVIFFIKKWIASKNIHFKVASCSCLILSHKMHNMLTWNTPDLVHLLSDLLASSIIISKGLNAKLHSACACTPRNNEKQAHRWRNC